MRVLSWGPASCVQTVNHDFTLRAAIVQKRLVRFMCKGLERIAEPHDYGIIDGVHRLFFYQVGGASRSGRPVGWRWAILEEMSDLEMLDRTFPGTRPTKTGKHAKWDVLIASVSRPHLHS